MAVTEQELEAVFAREASKIRAYLVRIVGIVEAADLTQEAFARAHQARASYRNETPIAAWVRRIARNVAIDHLRGASASPVSLGSSETESPGPTDLDQTEPGPERSLIRQEMRSCIIDLVRRLPERDANVIVLGEMRGLKDHEVAEALGITVGAAKIRLHRARARLRRMMEHSCELYPDEDGLACDRKA